MTSPIWSVEIHQRGRNGTIDYREENNVLSVDWEFGGREVVAIISTSATTTGEWDRMYPWAAGRQHEIMKRIGSETVRQKAPTCFVDFDPRSPWCVYVRELGPSAGR
jgi:hypothetical protein